MTIQLSLAIRGELGIWSREVAKVVDAGGRAALRRTTFGLRNNVRGRVRRAGFKSPGLAKAIAAKVTGRGQDLEGRVYSVARYRPGGFRRQPVDLIALFSEGATITPSGKWLAIPTGDGPRRASRGGSRSASPRELETLGWKIAVLPSRTGNAVILATSPGGAKVVTHVLVRRVTLRSRYDLQGAINLWVPRFPEILSVEINKRADASPTLTSV